MSEWTRERQSAAWTARSDGHDLSGADQDDMLAEIERAWGEIERLRVPAPLTEAACTVSAALSDHVSAAAPMSADECARLRAVIVAANNALVDVCRGDHEHQIECHLATLPDEHRRVATAAEKALEILRPVVAEMLEPDRGDIPDDTNPSKISNGSPLTREEARTWAHCALRRGADVPRVTAALLAASRGDIPDAVRARASAAVLLTAREAAEAMIDKGREMEAEGQRRLREVVRAERHRASADIPDDIRPEPAETVQAWEAWGRSVGAVQPATLTREEALRRLDALSPTAARHLSTARDWLAVYEKSAYRDSEHDEMAAILRAYLAGLPPAEAAPPFHAVWPMYDDGPEVKP